MAYNLSPVLNEQQFDANGDPRAGALITTYLAGTVTPVTTYKTSTGTAQSNPIVLDSSGNFPNGTLLWLLGGLMYKFVITDSTGANSRTYDNITGIGDNAATASEWILFAGAPTYISPTSFSLIGDQTNIFQVARRLQSINAGGTVYSTITASAFSAGVTTVTVVNTSGVLDSNISQVSYGILSATNPSVPAIYAKSGANTDITSLSTVTSINGGQLAGLRNRVINGGMQVDQRLVGTLKTYTAGAALSYAIDHWYGYCTGANVTGQQVNGTGQTFKRYQFNGAVAVTGIGFGHRIEQADCYDLNSQTCTLSVDLANTLLTAVTWTAYYANTANTFGTLAAPTRTQIATGSFTITSTVTRYNAQIAVPAAATTGIEVVFTVGAQISGTWTIGNVQLEIGTVGTTFEQRRFELELGFCQRFYEKSFPYSVVPAQNTGVVGAMLNFARVSGAAALAAYMPVYFKIPKFRTPATIVTFNPAAANAEVRDSVAAGDCSATTTTSAGENGFLVTATGNGATVQAGSIMQVQWTSEGEIP